MPFPYNNEQRGTQETSCFTHLCFVRMSLNRISIYIPPGLGFVQLAGLRVLSNGSSWFIQLLSVLQLAGVLLACIHVVQQQPVVLASTQLHHFFAVATLVGSLPLANNGQHSIRLKRYRIDVCACVLSMGPRKGVLCFELPSVIRCQ